MNREDITRLAQEAGFVGMDGDHGALRRFATLVAEHEREKINNEAKAHLQELRNNFDVESAELRLHMWSQEKKA